MSEKKLYVVEQTCSIVTQTRVYASSIEEAMALANKSWDWDTVTAPEPISGLTVFDDKNNMVFSEQD